ncbi:ArnT family glycosyltransferase [Prosthecobacter sp.]|uniref:ArnT family glycosyltransferase n=1 Tax=Prosthecobacter sp. TaxID=1965333 RepID=UPI0037843ABD
MSIRSQFLALLAICTVMFWWRLGHLPLIDPDEPFYAETTREMVQKNEWLTPIIFGERQFEKPIFFYWQSMIAMKLFGDNPFACRAPSAMAATLLVFLTWWFGRRMFSPRAGFWAAVVLASGVEYAIMSRLMLTDICLALCISASVFFFWLATEEEEKRDRWMILHFAASAFAFLTKGPVGLLVPTLGSICYLWLTKKRSPWRGKGLWLGLVVWAVIAVPWYAVMFQKYGMEYWHRFFVHENWERLTGSEHPHSNHWWWYLAIHVGGNLPWIPLLIAAVVRTVKGLKTDKRLLYLTCWFVPNIIFFTICNSKLPTYTFFLFVTLALIMGHTLDQWISQGFRSKGERILVATLVVLQTALVIGAGPVISLILPPKESNVFIKDLVPVIYILAGIISIPMVLMLKQRIAAWAGSTVMVTAGLVLLMQYGVNDKIPMYTSTRDIAAEAEKVRKPGEPIISSSFIARAVTYYTGSMPSGVVYFSVDPNKLHPYFTAHPPLHMLRNGVGVQEFAKDYSSILCIFLKQDVDTLEAPGSPLQGQLEILKTLGGRMVVRIKGGKP